MVDIRTYHLWCELASRDDLPTAALPAVIEALTTPIDPHDSVGGNAERWRTSALQDALPALLKRTGEPELRVRLVAGGSREQIAQLVMDGVLGSEDLAAITAAHQVWPDLVAAFARHDHQVPTAIELVTRLSGHDLVSVLHSWEFSERALRTPGPAPEIPARLLKVMLESCLRPLTDSLALPENGSDWITDATRGMGRNTSLGGPAWEMLTRCRDQWPRLVEHPDHGRSVQHLLLDHADPEGLSDDLLTACLPSLTCQELADLPKPSATERRRLRHIAQRVVWHPRVRQMASDQLHAAADDCVKRGRLLHAGLMKNRFGHEVASLAEDLALTCATPQHLARVCGFLGQLPQPSVIVTPPRAAVLVQWQQVEGQSPRFLLGLGSDHRVKALAELAANPYTPHEALSGVLDQLHPVEIGWLQQHDDLPGWFRQATSAHAPSAPDDGILRILTDDQLDAHPAPESVLHSWLDWLDVVHGDRLGAAMEVERAVLNSRHRTEAVLRRLPAERVLTYGTPETAAPLLVELCGDRPEQWASLLTALERVQDTITFGEFLDGFPHPFANG